jgi:uncharacterized protein (DUF1499 family)
MLTVAALTAVAGPACSGSAGRGPGELPAPQQVLSLLAKGSSSNVAATSDTATDPRLRPRTYPLPPVELAHAVVDALDSLPRWNVVAGRDGVIWATRRTRVFRFVDDIYLLLVPGRDSTTVYARSASRVGRGDLGQNRRNLAELWSALDTKVAERRRQPD